jgi:hypothetical protein
MSLELLDEYHASHDCNPGRCICVCGCEEEIGCTVLTGGMCSVCFIREQRDDGDGPHGYPAERTGAEPR